MNKCGLKPSRSSLLFWDPWEIIELVFTINFPLSVNNAFWQACRFHKINILIGCSLLSYSNTTYKNFPGKSVYLLFIFYSVPMLPFFLFLASLPWVTQKSLISPWGALDRFWWLDLSLFFFHMKARPEDASHIHTHNSKIILRHYIVLNKLCK